MARGLDSRETGDFASTSREGPGMFVWIRGTRRLRAESSVTPLVFVRCHKKKSFRIAFPESGGQQNLGGIVQTRHFQLVYPQSTRPIFDPAQ